MKINDIADIINVTEKDPATSGIDIFVGLEHYDIAEPVIKRFGSTKMLSTAAKKFETGDVLIARRNVYLQRASVARFAGLTSGDSIVLRVKKDLDVKGTDYDNMCALIPFILNSINFWDYANTNADGTMSKRLSPAMLLDYEFTLPSLAEQKVLAERLWAAYEVKQSYLKMIAATEEMVKAQFVEMFGENSTIPFVKTNVESLCSSIVRGPFGSAITTSSFVPKSSTTVKVYEQKNAIQKSATLGDYYITREHYEKLKRFECHPNDIIMSCAGTIGELYQLPSNIEKGIINQALCKFTLNKKVEDEFFLYYLKMNIQNLEKKGSGMKNIGSVSYIKSMPINLPSLNDQQSFVRIKHQADKSISELRKSVDAIDKVIKSLINENL